jgi:hypothetical protein
MAADDTVETVKRTAGTFTSTFVALEDCPNHWVPRHRQRIHGLAHT